MRAAGVILPLEGRPGTRRAPDSRPNGGNGRAVYPFKARIWGLSSSGAENLHKRLTI